MENKFKHVHSEVIIFQPTILENIESNKVAAIKRIMTVVDAYVQDKREHQQLRKIVLDSVNDASRDFAKILDSVIEKYTKIIQSKDRKIEIMELAFDSLEIPADKGEKTEDQS